MKKTLAIMLALIMVLAMVPALADNPPTSGNCGAPGNEDKVTWKLEQNNADTANPTYTLTISGSGAMKDFTVSSSNDDRPWSDFISRITKGVVTQGVTNVGDRTFYNCSKMASVELADGITSITGGAFENCTSLTSLALPNSLEKFGGNAFKGCAGLTGELVIPDSVREIRNWAFMNCKSISSVSIGKNVESISESAFEKCQSLKSITFKGKTKTIGLNAFRETSLMSLTLPDGLETIGPNAFYGIATLSGMLVIPDSVTKIENQAFWTGRTSGEGSLSNISGIRVDSPKIHIGNSAFKATGADYIDLTRVDELSSWGNWVLDENESCIIYAKSDSVLNNVKNSQHVTNYIYALTSGGIFADNTVFPTDTLATPVKSGHIFGGWYENANFSGSAVTNAVDGGTYYANWDVTQVEFLPGEGGRGVMPGANLVENNTLIFPECIFTAPVGKEFAGWKITNPGGYTALYQKDDSVRVVTVEPTPIPDSAGNPTGWAVTVTAQWKDKQPEQPQPSENPNPSPSTDPSASPTPTPTPYNGGGGNGGGYWHPTTTPVPVIVIPPKTGDMTIWQSILHFLGIR